MLSHRLERDVLVITIEKDPGVSGRAGLATEITELVHAYRTSPVLLVIDRAASTPATASAVLRAHRQVGELNTLLSVATQDAATRRLLEDNADTCGSRLVVHTHVDVALDTAYVSAA
ncbi:hypothetical protein ACFWXI_32580 [[Kitasatospora] papulosa]|uniref:hypothetical protein n=1 Tax=[Kitasatospora] papulosa TaxID=1464011 RepID=UPI0036ACF63F